MPTVVDSKLVQQLIRDDDQIRDEAAACDVALKSLPKSTPMKDHFYARVTSLTKASVDSKEKLKRGDVVWTVEILNAAASDVNPTPESICWVRAKDGSVFPLVPQS